MEPKGPVKNKNGSQPYGLTAVLPVFLFVGSQIRDGVFHRASSNLCDAFRNIFDDLTYHIFGTDIVGALRMIASQMDCIEGALCRADSAADAAVVVHNRGAAAQAAAGLNLNLLFGEGLFVLVKGLCNVDPVHQLGFLSFGRVVGVNGDIVLVELDKVAVLPAKVRESQVGRTKRWMDSAASWPSPMALMTKEGP